MTRAEDRGAPDAGRDSREGPAPEGPGAAPDKAEQRVEQDTGRPDKELSELSELPEKEDDLAAEVAAEQGAD